MDSTQYCYKPNSFLPYFHILTNIYRRTNGTLDFDIRSAVKNWDHFVTGELDVYPDNLLNSFFYEIQLNNDIRESIKINKDSDFIKITNPIIQELKDKFKSDIRVHIEKRCKIELKDLMNYRTFVENEDYDSMIAIITKSLAGRFPNKLPSKTIDLIIRITDCPYLDTVDLLDYNCEYDNNVIKKISSLSDSKRFAELLIKFRKSINKVKDDYEFTGTEFNVNEILSSLLKDLN